MGITERVARMAVQVSSPNGAISASLDGRDDVRLNFAPGYYERASEHDVETQLAHIAKLLWAARMREYNAIVLEEYKGNLIMDPVPLSQRDVDFYERRNSVVAEGRSSDGRIQVSVRGMREWNVSVASGATRELRADEFASAAAGAARQLIADQRAKVRELRIETFAPEFVADFKE